MKLALLLPLLTMVFRTSHAKDAVVRGNGGRLRDLQEELSMSMSMSMLGDLSRAGVELASFEVFPASKSSKECTGTTLNIKVKTDDYPEQTNAIITDLCKTPDGPFETRVGLPLLAFVYDELSEGEQAAYDADQFDKSEHEFNYCLPKSKYSLTMFDDNGDGFLNNDAGYEVSVDGITIQEFGGVFNYADTELDFGDCPRKKSSKSGKECKGTTLNIKVTTDEYPEDTYATITDLCKTPDGPFETRVGLPLLAFLYDELSEEEQDNFDANQFDKSEYEFNYCLPKSKYNLTMFDDYGDGFLNDDAGYISGYEVSVDGITIKEFDGFVEDYKDTELQFGDCPRKKSSKSGKECKGTTLNIKVTTDEFPEDTNAIITDLCKTPDGPFETRVGLPLLAFLYDELSEGDKSDHEFNYCLPKSKYNLTMFDDFGDGFLDDDTGYEVSVDGKIIQTFRGNFSFYKDIELEFGDCPRKKSSKSSK